MTTASRAQGVPVETTASMRALGDRAVRAARAMALASGAQKEAALLAGADLLEANEAEILQANVDDVETAEARQMPVSSLDRLRLDHDRVRQMASGLRLLAAASDPIGAVVSGERRPNGLRVERVRVPLGVIGIIYENRPNVTSDAGGLCLKAGNAAMLRGSSSALASNRAIVGCLREALMKVGLPDDAVVLVEDTSREAAVAFMQLDGIIDCLVPRGGRDLLQSVRDHTTVPVVIDGDGNCHLYVDESADLDMALSIAENAKTQRPGVCNAVETLLVHGRIADAFLPRLAATLIGVELRGDERVRAILPGATPATDSDFATEFLDLILAVAVVDDLGDAIEHIATYGSGHSEAIVTSDVAAADRFVHEVDAAAVVVNSSTRFVDGGELGLGAEIGISTQKLHARGPMGAEALTSVKWVVRGEGQIR